MSCAARCSEGASDWARAEALIRAISERYPDVSMVDWYLFCKRTGHGDLAAARDFVEQYLTAHADRPDLQNEEFAGYFYWLEGRNDEANKAFTRAFQNRKSISAAIALAIIADDEKDAARRNELLKELVTKYKDTVAQIARDLPDLRRNTSLHRRARAALSTSRRWTGFWRAFLKTGEATPSSSWDGS